MAGEREACLKTNEHKGEKNHGASERTVGRFCSSSPVVPPPGAKASGGGVLPLGGRGSDLVVFPTSVGLSRFSDHLHMRSLAPVRRCEAFFFGSIFWRGSKLEVVLVSLDVTLTPMSP